MRRKLAGAVITMLVAGLVAGCGGDGDGDSGGEDDAAATTTTASGGTLTKSAYVERADAICATAAKRLNAAGAKLRPKNGEAPKLTRGQIARFLTQNTVPSYERLLSGLRDLTPPQRDKAKVDAYLASIRRGIDAIKTKPEAYARLDAANPFTDANKRAKAYGFKVCGS